MHTELAANLLSPAERGITQDAMFVLYSLLLKRFIEPIYGWDENYQKQRFATEHPQKRTKIILAGESMAGFVVVMPKLEAQHLSLLLLQPEFQGVGVGREVMRQIVSTAKAEGKSITLSCFKTNKEALLFHQRLGFTAQNEEQHFVLLASAA